MCVIQWHALSDTILLPFDTVNPVAARGPELTRISPLTMNLPHVAEWTEGPELTHLSLRSCDLPLPACIAISTTMSALTHLDFRECSGGFTAEGLTLVGQGSPNVVQCLPLPLPSNLLATTVLENNCRIAFGGRLFLSLDG
jgi:hypothetical protein